MYVANQNTAIFKQNHQVRLLVLLLRLYILFFWVYLFYLHMEDFLYGQCSKGAGGTYNALDLKFSLLNLSLDVMVWDIFNTKMPN